MTRDEVQAVIDAFKVESARAVFAGPANAFGDAAKMLTEALEKSEAAHPCEDCGDPWHDGRRCPVIIEGTASQCACGAGQVPS